MQFTIDMSKWRCGFDSDHKKNRIGRGDTLLLNECGYMCCLGQLSLQLGKTKGEIMGMRSPDALDESTKHLSRKRLGLVLCTKLSGHAIVINDDEETTVNQKMKLLRALFKKHGHTVRFTNDPRKTQKGTK